MSRTDPRIVGAVSAAGFGFGMLLGGAVYAADAARYPMAPVRAVVPYAPGGGTDILARQVGAKLQERWGQPLLVDNRPGGATVIGAEIVARAPADGQTLLFTTGTHAVNVILLPKLPFDPLRSFEPVTLLAQAPNVLVVHPSLPTRSVKELIALAKARPGQLSYSSSGTGDTGHLAMELLKQTAGVDIVHVPYKGAAPSIAALVGGEVGVSVNNLIVALPQVKANRIRALAVTSAKRAVTLPEIPALAEAGLPGFHAIGWFAVFAPAKTPPAIVAKLSDDIRAVLELPDVKQSITALGAEASGSSPKELEEWVRGQIERWRRVLANADIKRD